MLQYWLWYALLPGLRVWQKHRLLEQLSDPEDLYRAERRTLQALPGITGEMLDALENRDLDPARKVLRSCTDGNIHVLSLGDGAYPARLRAIDDPPIVLYYRGRLPDFDDRPTVAVVGTRKASPYGLQTARLLSAQLAAGGALVVSGGAGGIDTMAMQGALDAGTGPVAVLGGGPDVVYPARNRQLFEQTVQTGCLLSEYPPGTPAYRWNFPARNRIISGLSLGTLVVEAPERSGALITARDALEQNREVFVVPGNIDVTSCAGSNRLLREGAMAVFSGYDILREYEQQFPGKIHRQDVVPLGRSPEIPPEKVAEDRVLPENFGNKPEKVHKKGIDNGDKSSYSVLDGQLSRQEQAIYALLDAQPQSVDDIISASDLPPGSVLSVLTMLKIKGLVQDHPGRRVSLKNR